MTQAAAIRNTTVERCGALSEKEFVAKYKETATPVILTELMEGWPARSKWSVDYLDAVAGENIVPVYSSKPARDKQHQHAAEQTIKLSEYLSMLKAGENDLRMFFYNLLENVPTLLNDIKYPELGLKFFKRLPVLFVGGRGARVQMHYDIDLADLVLCHFGGPKKVMLISPEQSKYMYRVPYSFSALADVNFENPDFDKYPALQQIDAQWADLEHGDALYIPSGYWHYVIYQDIGFSMTLRAFPTKLKGRLSLIKNIFFTRLVEGFMRKCFGQRWNDRNERLAVALTHKDLEWQRESGQ